MSNQQLSAELGQLQIALRRRGKRVKVVPNTANPWYPQISALVAALIQVEHPEIRGLARSATCFET
jgi:hypothetical protein